MRVTSLSIALLIATCGLQLVLIQLRDDLYALPSLMTIPVLTALLLKTPARKDALIGLSILGAGVVLIAITAIIVDALAWAPSGFQVGRNGISRIPILNEFIYARWEGPFGNVNYAGPAGAFVIFLGIMARHHVRPILILGGVGILLLSQSRTAVAGLLLGLACAFLFDYRENRYRFSRTFRLLALAALTAAIALYVIVFDPTLGLRTDVWRDFLQLWSQNPWSGVGDIGVQAYLDGPLQYSQYPKSHAHNVLLDIASRRGALLAITAAATLICIGIVAFSAIPRIGSAPFGLWVLVVTMSLTETTFNFHSLNHLYVPLLAVLLASGQRDLATSPHAILMQQGAP